MAVDSGGICNAFSNQSLSFKQEGIISYYHKQIGRVERESVECLCRWELCQRQPPEVPSSATTATFFLYSIHTNRLYPVPTLDPDPQSSPVNTLSLDLSNLYCSSPELPNPLPLHPPLLLLPCRTRRLL